MNDQLNVLVKIPDSDIASGRHEYAKCLHYLSGDCSGPVRYHMVVETPPDNALDTEYFCEAHKPNT